MQLSWTFISLAEIRSASQVSDINTNNHKSEQEIFIVISTKTFINKLFQEGYISPAEKLKFYCSKTWLFLKHSVFVDISKRDVASFDDLLYLVKKT